MKPKLMEKDSAYTGELPDGCKYCREGSKLVLLITGLCPGSCWYCPLSEKKKGNDVLYANEKPCFTIEEVLEEAHTIDAEGTGITGGDPLVSDRTADYIRALKTEFGEDHHIHLYTCTTDMGKIHELQDAGLDEIRFHPLVERWGDIEESGYPEFLEDLKSLDIDVGIEIPSIPKRREDTIHLLKSLGSLVDFINLNELEFSSTNWQEMVKRGYRQKSDISSAVKGSEELALDLLEMNFGTSVHYCSASFKDGVQLTNRIKRRAKNIARPGDIITEEGTLIKGVIITDNPDSLIDELVSVYEVPEEMICYNDKKNRIEINIYILEEIYEDLDADCYGVEEYPTADRLEVERWYLQR